MNNNPLRIVEIRHWLVFMPFRDTISWAAGARSGSTRLICEVTTAGGVKGYGETICLLDFVPVVFEKVVAPLAMGRSVADVERLSRHCEGVGYYHHRRAIMFSLCAMEMAMWDAFGKHLGQPLSALWGGTYRQRVELCAVAFITDPGALSDELAHYREQGFTSFKIKAGLSFKQDVALVECARSVLGPSANLRVDPNGTWTPGTARRMLDKLRPYDLQFIEQPLPVDDLIGHAELRKVSSTPICIDEGVYTLQDAMNAIRLGAADVILVDPHEAGGLWQCLKVAAVAEAAGIHVGMHSGGELGLSQAAYLHLAASIPNATIAIDTLYQHHVDDILPIRLTIVDGGAAVPDGPGLGVDVCVEKLKTYRVDEISSGYRDPARPDWFTEKPTY